VRDLCYAPIIASFGLGFNPFMARDARDAHRHRRSLSQREAVTMDGFAVLCRAGQVSHSAASAIGNRGYDAQPGSGPGARPTGCRARRRAKYRTARPARLEIAATTLSRAAGQGPDLPAAMRAGGPSIAQRGQRDWKSRLRRSTRRRAREPTYWLKEGVEVRFEILAIPRRPPLTLPSPRTCCAKYSRNGGGGSHRGQEA
jgi:hypothetical protein